MLLLGRGLRNRLRLRSLLDDRAEHRGVNEAHQEESLKDGVRELGSLFEELGCLGRVAHH